MTPSGLTGRLAAGILWIAGSVAVVRVFGLLQTVIVARLLSPTDFGLYAMVAMSVGSLEVVTRLGLREAVVQARGEIEPILASVFWVGFVRGALVYGVLYFAAPAFEDFFGARGLADLLRVAGLAIPIRGLGNVGLALFARDLDYKRAAIYSQVQVLLGGLATLALAVALRDVWALALAPVVAAALIVPISYWAHPYRPGWRVESTALAHVFRYTRYVFGSAPLLYASNHVDDLVVGRAFGSHALGAYQVAYNTSAIPASWLSEVILSAIFPVFAKLQQDPEALRSAFRRSLRHLASLSLPAAAGLLLFAREIVTGLYGAKWESAIPLLMAFSVYGAARTIGGPVFELFKATGETREVFVLALLNLIGITWVVFIGAPHGPIWIALLVSAIGVPFAVYGLDRAARRLDVPLGWLVAAILPAVAATLGATAVTWLTLGGEASFGRLALGVPLFGVLYAATLAILDRSWAPELLGLLRAARVAGFR